MQTPVGFVGRIVAAGAVASICWGFGGVRLRAQQSETPSNVEEIYVFRSVSERVTQEPATGVCASAAPFKVTSENYYSLWSVVSDNKTGQVIDAKRERIGELYNCIAANADGTTRFYTIGNINGIAFKGPGDQAASQQTATVQSRVNRFLLDGLPAPYVAGMLSSNTVRLTPAASAGYVLSSVGIIRLWKARGRSGLQE